MLSFLRTRFLSFMPTVQMILLMFQRLKEFFYLTTPAIGLFFENLSAETYVDVFCP